MEIFSCPWLGFATEKDDQVTSSAVDSTFGLVDLSLAWTNGFHSLQESNKSWPIWRDRGWAGLKIDLYDNTMHQK